MSVESFEDAIRQQFTEIRKELADLGDLLRGRPQAGWYGVLDRVNATDKQVKILTDLQEAATRERESERIHQQRRDKLRNRVTSAVLTVMSGVLVGILVQLFVLISHIGVHP